MIKFLSEKDKYYWLWVIFTAVLCFGFILTNYSVGIDDEMLDRYSTIRGMLFDNRLGNILTARILNTWEYLPFWRDFLSMVLYIIGISLHAVNFEKFIPGFTDKKIITVFACLAVSFPYIAFNAIFIVTCLEQGLILILSAFAVYCFNKYFFEEKQIKYIIYTFATLVLVISFYESGVLYFLTASFFIVMCKIICKNPLPSGKFPIKITAFAFSLSFAAYLLNIAINMIIQKLFNIHYLRINDFFKYNLNSVESFFNSFYFNISNLVKNFVQTLSYDFGSVILLFCLSVLILIIPYYSLKHKNIYILLMGGGILILPFTSFWLTGNYEWPYRVYASFCITEGITFILIYNLCRHNEKLIKIFLIMAAIIVLQQTKEFNQILYTEHLKFKNDAEFAASIMNDLQRLNLDEKPVIFIGTRKNPELRHSYYAEAAEVNISIFNWDRYNNIYAEIFVRRGIYFMRELGYNVKGFWDIPEDILKNTDSLVNLIKENTKEMNIYPRENSIRDLGEFVLIKTGESEADK